MNKLIPIFFFFIFLTLSALTSNLHAATSKTLYCNDRIVSIGDHQRTVEEKCGPPAFIDQIKEAKIISRYKVREEVRTQDGDPGHRSWPNFPWKEKMKDRSCGPSKKNDSCELLDKKNFVVEREEWTYNFGPSRFIQTLGFEDNRLISLETDGYGYDEKHKSRSIVQRGDSKAIVTLKYGPPTYSEKNQEEHVIAVNHKWRDGFFIEEEVRKIIEVETWTYDFGEGRIPQILHFRNNRLGSIQ